MKHCTFTAESPLNCVARPVGCRSDDGRDSVLLDQLAHMLLVLLHLFVPVFYSAFLNAAIAVPGVPASSAPCPCADNIIMPALDRGQSFHFADCFMQSEITRSKMSIRHWFHKNVKPITAGAVHFWTPPSTRSNLYRFIGETKLSSQSRRHH